MMSPDREIAVARLILELEPIRGRTRLQKLVHLLKSAGFEDFKYRFILHFFGPFSHELASDTGFLTDAEFVTEDVPCPEGGTYQYRVPQQVAQQVRTLYDTHSGDPPWKDLAKKLGGESSPRLEAMSTLVFLHERGISGETLKEKFVAVKPHLASDVEGALKRARDLDLL